MICESYTRRTPKPRTSRIEQVPPLGSLGNETRKHAAAKEIAKIEKDGVNDAAKALLAAEIA